MNCSASACQYGVSSSELELNTRSAPRHTHCYPASARLRTCLPSRASSVTQPETAGDIAPASISYEDEDAKRDALDSLLGQVLQRPDALSAVSTLHGRSRKAIKLFVVITPDVYKGLGAGPRLHYKPARNVDVRRCRNSSRTRERRLTAWPPPTSPSPNNRIPSRHECRRTNSHSPRPRDDRSRNPHAPPTPRQT